jgi:hypothetical protein
MMKLTSVGAVIATRKLTLHGGKEVIITIGKPKKFRDGSDYYCPYRITGMGDELVRYAGGVDPVQALQLTFVHIGVRLSTSKEATAGKLKWEAGSTKEDFGFPEK